MHLLLWLSANESKIFWTSRALVLSACMDRQERLLSRDVLKGVFVRFKHDRNSSVLLTVSPCSFFLSKSRRIWCTLASRLSFLIPYNCAMGSRLSFSRNVAFLGLRADVPMRTAPASVENRCVISFTSRSMTG